MSEYGWGKVDNAEIEIRHTDGPPDVALDLWIHRLVGRFHGQAITTRLLRAIEETIQPELQRRADLERRLPHKAKVWYEAGAGKIQVFIKQKEEAT